MSAVLLAAATELVDLFFPRSTDWFVVNAMTSDLVIRPDTVSGFEYRGESRVSDYPMEQGAFSSYDKVSTPFDARMRMVCSGNETMSREEFLDTIERMLREVEVYDLVTPDKTYPSMTLVHFDYRRESTNGVTLLIVDAWFREVRITASSDYTSDPDVPNVQSDSPSAASMIKGGTVTVSIPSKEQAAAYNSGGEPQ
jgi:hypothetical protein